MRIIIAETDTKTAVELWPGDAASFKRVMTAVAWLDNQLFERARTKIHETLSRLFKLAQDSPSDS